MHLVAYQLPDMVTGGGEVLTGVKVVGMLGHVLTDGGGHGQTQVAVDIDLADGHLGGVAQHLLGDADGIGHLAAEAVDGFNIGLNDRGRTVQNDGEAGQTLADLLQDIEAQLGLLAGLELVGAVAGADGDGQGVYAGAGHKFLYLGGVGELGVRLADIDGVLDAGQLAQLALYHDAALVGVFHHLAGHGDVFFKVQLGTVDHHGGKTAVDAVLADLEAVAVIEVQRDGNIGIQHGGLHQLGEVNMLGVLAGAGGNLQDDRGLLQLGGLGDGLNDLHVVDIEGADGVAALVGLAEHFLGSDQWHNISSLNGDLSGSLILF